MSYFSKVTIRDAYGWQAENTPMDEMRVATAVRLVGSTFVGNVLDSNFWTASTASGTVAQLDGEVILSSQTMTTGSAVIQSVRYGRYVGGAANRYRSQLQFGDVGVPNNTKRWGMFDGLNGAYFKLSGTTMYACTMKNGSESGTASSLWNGSTTVPTLTNCNTYEIYITNRKVYYVIAGTLVHTGDYVAAPWTATTTLPVRADNINSGNTTNTQMKIRVQTIYRLGEMVTLPTYKNVTTISASGGQILKRGPGNLHRVVINAVGAGTSLAIYDNITASNLIGTISYGTKNDAPLTLEYHLPFANGLYVVATGGAWDCTFVYE